MIKYLFSKLVSNSIGKLVTTNNIISSGVESSINYMINYVPPSNKMFPNTYYFIQNPLINNNEKIYVNLYHINYHQKDSLKYKDNQFYFNGDFIYFTEGMKEPFKCNNIIINFDTNVSTGEIGHHIANYVIPDQLFKNNNDLKIHKTKLIIEKAHVSYGYHLYHIAKMKYINFNYFSKKKESEEIELGSIKKN